jgi:hypothetical protein
MDYFAEDKADKLKRLAGLRIANALGVIAWREDRYGCAQQLLRLLHPLSWIYLMLVIQYSVVAYGVIEVSKELKNLWRDETVWW